MHESDAYYEENLYPLQNGVLSTLAACDAPFYLTGGTALHRHYFGFRYSEYRLESKDIANLWAICTRRPFHWSDVMAEANQKEAGIDAATVADLVCSFPQHLFATILWRAQPDEQRFFSDLAVIASDLLAVRENSLYLARG